MPVRQKALLALIFCLLYGCAREKPFERLIKSSSPYRPPWISKTPEARDGKEFFVGRALAVNVLDERRALLRAKHNAAYNIAFSILAEVKGISKWGDTQRGDEVWAGEILDTDQDYSLEVLVHELIPGIRVEESYWELWEVRSPTHHIGREEKNDIFRRYKYYVLVSISQEELKRLREEAKKNAVSS